MLTGEAKRLFEMWRLDGHPFEELLARIKEYSRGVRIDDDALRGKPGVEAGKAQNQQPKEELQEEVEENQGDYEAVNENWQGQVRSVQETWTHNRTVLVEGQREKSGQRR